MDKYSVWKKLLATGSALGALALSAVPAQAANPDTVVLGPLGQGVGLSENVGNGDRVAFTVHSYVAYAAVDVTGVYDGAFLSGVQFQNQGTATCAPGAAINGNETGTNLFDGDIWYVGCVGIYAGIEGEVTVN